MRSKYENPMYIHEEGCEVATTIQVNPPPEGWSDEVEFQYTLTVTKNAQMVEVVDLKSGRKHQAILIYKLNIEFLRDLSSVEMQTAIFSGLKQDILKKRATYTFGVMTTPPFQKGKDPDNYKFVDNEGVVRNRGVFYKLIKKGTLMSSGQIFSAQVRFVPWVGFQSFSLYRCPSENPDIEDGEVVASVCPYRHGLPCSKLEVQIVVKDTYFVFKVIDMESRQEWIEDIL
ncbi:uncharacterized protein LOC128242287 [Mya arenaria]|uniref:uncharacterized protein LOC128242287 n=1 Tax=Mya arenaria TaxID=6604 RepID=UPI0022E3176B|nr:uncharacterized protein LOC128242287 [Mya arenaria]